jgi:hypothetical protein
MDLNNEYEDDYYETSEIDMIHFDEEYDEETHHRLPPRSSGSGSDKKKSLRTKKKRLEDWLEEKRLRDALKDNDLDS